MSKIEGLLSLPRGNFSFLLCGFGSRDYDFCSISQKNIFGELPFLSYAFAKFCFVVFPSSQLPSADSYRRQTHHQASAFEGKALAARIKVFSRVESGRHGGTAVQIIEQHPEVFTPDFSYNKMLFSYIFLLHR